MLKGFTSILVKELKELMRDPKILIGMIVLPLVMFPVLGLVMGYAVETAQSEARHANLVIVDNDGGEWSSTFINYVNNSMNVVIINNTTPQHVVDQGLLYKNNSTMFMLVPQGVSENLTRHVSG